MKKRVALIESSVCNHRPLNERHYLAISMLAAGATNQQLARALNVSYRQVCQWKNRPDFQKELSEIVNDTRDAVRKEIRSMVCLALKTLRMAMMRGSRRQPTSRDALMAAVKVIQIAGIDKDLIGAEEPNPDESFL